MLQEQSLPTELRELNRNRLDHFLKKTTYSFFHDVDHFLIDSDKRQNIRSINLLAQHLKDGIFMAAVSGRGDGINDLFTNPLIEMLGPKTDLADIPSFICPYNAALIQHISGLVIYDKPIDDVLYDEITSHPMMKAIQKLTPRKIKSKQTTSLIQAGVIDPKTLENPGIRHNWSQQMQKRYQLSCPYNPELVQNTSKKLKSQDIEILQHYCEGTIPKSQAELAQYLKSALFESGIDVSVTTAQGFDVVDIAHPEVSKKLAFDILESTMTYYFGMDKDDLQGLKSFGVAGGDSPLGNDAPLMTMFNYGITNNESYWNNYTETGPIILDFPEVEQSAQKSIYTPEYMRIEQTQAFLRHLNQPQASIYT